MLKKRKDKLIVLLERITGSISRSVMVKRTNLLNQSRISSQKAMI